VTIPAGTTNAPSLVASGSATTRNLNVTAGASLNLYSSSTLHVKGNLTNNSDVTGAGILSMSGTTAQTVDGIGSLNNMDVNNTAGVTVNTGGRVTIKSTLGVTGGYLATGDSVVLASDSTATARILQLPSSGVSISGKVQVRKYVEGGRRAYRFWAHPFSTNISLAQIEKYIDITGPGGVTNGFTYTTTGAPSAFRYDPTIANSALAYDPGWRPFTSALTTSDTNGVHQYEGIRLFVRGLKGEGLTGYYYLPSAVTIGMSGPVNQGDQVISLQKGTGANQDYNMVGNPYPSPVDIGTIAYNAYNSSQMAGAAIFVWKPYMGSVGQFQAIPVNTGTPYNIEGYTSFQIRADHNGATLNFAESDKTATYANTLLKTLPAYLSLTVYDNSYHPWDILRVQFNDAATDAEDNKYDAVKPNGPAELNFYSMSADNKKMAIDARPYKAEKVIPLGIASTVAQDFIIKVDGMDVPAGSNVYLHDILLNQYTLLSQGIEYRFSITTDKATQGDKRFELSLDPAAAVTNKALQVTMQPNPATDEVKISFTSGRKDKVEVRMLDLSGVSVYNTDLGVQQSGSVNVPIGTLASGIYMVELTQGDQKVVQRLVKE